MAERFSCETCGCDVSKQITTGGAIRWVDTRGSSLCPSWKSRFHHPNPVALAVLDEPRHKGQERCPVCGGLNPGDISHTRCM